MGQQNAKAFARSSKNLKATEPLPDKNSIQSPGKDLTCDILHSMDYTYIRVPFLWRNFEVNLIDLLSEVRKLIAEISLSMINIIFQLNSS